MKVLEKNFVNSTQLYELAKSKVQENTEDALIDLIVDSLKEGTVYLEPEHYRYYHKILNKLHFLNKPELIINLCF